MLTSSKNFKIIFSIFAFVLAFGFTINTFAADNTNLSITIQSGALSVDIVDNNGSSVAVPGVTMGTVTASFSSQTSTGTLGVTSQKIRLSNATSTAIWGVSIAATSGSSALWTSTGGTTMDYNSDTNGTGTLTINPATGTIVAVNHGNTTGVSLGSNTAFSSGATSITLYSAAGGAATFEQYDLKGVALSQEVPLGQQSANYTLNLTLTAV